VETTPFQVVSGGWISCSACVHTPAQVVTLLCMWLIPVVICVKRDWWRFLFIWLIFSIINSFVTYHSTRPQVGGNTPRCVLGDGTRAPSSQTRVQMVSSIAQDQLCSGHCRLYHHHAHTARREFNISVLCLCRLCTWYGHRTIFVVPNHTNGWMSA
jgi:hypothetical protein